MSDIFLKNDNFYFSYRVAGVLIYNHKVLLQREVNTRDYAFPGGHVKFGETSYETLVREFKEEINLDIKVGKLMWIGEIFFPIKDNLCQQICLYYEVKPCENLDMKFNELHSLEEKITFKWLDLDKIENYMIYPYQAKTFLKEKTEDVKYFEYHESQLDIHKTTLNDLENIQKIWNDGEVMKFVGFSEGLKMSSEKMITWYKWVNSRGDNRRHYSIYCLDKYCGETFYNLDDNGYVSIDIKLNTYARGQGVAFQAVSFVIKQAFTNSNAQIIWVDPNPKNEKALKLYKRLGFVIAKRPDCIDSGEGYDFIYMELTRKRWFS